MSARPSGPAECPLPASVSMLMMCCRIVLARSWSFLMSVIFVTPMPLFKSFLGLDYLNIVFRRRKILYTALLFARV